MLVKHFWPERLKFLESINLPISTPSKLLKKAKVGLMIGFVHSISVIFGQFAI
jgi:hypothetical protein